MHSHLVSLGLKPPYAIVGTGITGNSVLRLLLKMNVDAKEICTFDKSDPKAIFSDGPKLISEFQPKTLFVSPGVPLATDWIQRFVAGGGRISSELELAFSFLTKERVIAVTGSIAKSTTTALIAAAAQAFSPSAFIGGNFGTPLADYAFQILSGTPASEYIILELSSYQLENFNNLSADVSVLTYLSANHLERYDGLEQYYQTKLQLLRKTKSAIIINKDGGDNQATLAAKSFGDLNLYWTSRQSDLLKKHRLTVAKMLGTHNQENLAMAAQVAEFFQWPEAAYVALREFSGLAHRLENCGLHAGVQFINDSKATAMDSVLQATQSVLPLVKSGHTLHLLLGGKDKGLPWHQLSDLKNYSQIRFTFFGAFAEGAKSQSLLQGNIHSKLQPALDEVLATAKAGDIVLLSPGGTSLDEFKGFEDRGNFFKSYLKLHAKNNG